MAPRRETRRGRETAKRRISPALLWVGVVAGTLLAGILGMRLVLGLSWVDALYYTAITLSTLGYDAPPHMTDGGKLFLVLYLAVSVGGVWFGAGKLLEIVLLGRLLETLGRRRDRRATRMRDHWILCGLGRVGEHVAEHFEHDGIPFCGVESDPVRVQSARDRGWTVLSGDAKDETVLRAANLETAQGIVVALAEDADNVYVALNARSVRKDLRIVARANEPQSVPILYRAGADKVINPVTAGAAAIARAAVKPTVAEFLDLSVLRRRLGADFQSVRIAADSPLCGRPLAESGLRSRFDALAVAILREGQTLYNPSGAEALRAGDELVLLIRAERIGELRALASGPGEA